MERVYTERIGKAVRKKRETGQTLNIAKNITVSGNTLRLSTMNMI